jgi:hypothetical protein
MAIFLRFTEQDDGDLHLAEVKICCTATYFAMLPARREIVYGHMMKRRDAVAWLEDKRERLVGQDKFASNPVDPTVAAYAGARLGAEVLLADYRGHLGFQFPGGPIVRNPELGIEQLPPLPLPEIPLPHDPIIPPMPLPPLPPHVPMPPVEPLPPLPGPDIPPILEIPGLDQFAPEFVRHALDVIFAAGLTVGDIVRDLWAGVVVPLPFVMPALRAYQYYTQLPRAVHDGTWRFYGHERSVAPTPLADADLLTLAAANAYRTHDTCVRTTIDPWYRSIRRDLSEFTDTDGLQKKVAERVEHEFTAMRRHRDAQPKICLNARLDTRKIEEVAAALPGFRVHACNSPHVHSVPQAIREAVMIKMNTEINARAILKVQGVGLSPRQAAGFAGLCHNCGPVLSGRDYYRQNHGYSAVDRAAFAQITEDHRYQDCPHGTHPELVIAPFSAQDISAIDFAKQMIRSGAHTAWVLVNVPVPFLDARVRRFRDPDNGFLFERRGANIDMFFTDGATGGYSNDGEALMSWVSPAPAIQGYQVTIEERFSFGSTYWLEMKVAPGAAEVVPTMFRAAREDFIVLPLLQPAWALDQDASHDFAVPERRFRALVTFLSSVPPGDVKFNVAANKLRGQMAEVRIGKVTVENRLDLDTGQFFSLVGHALLAYEMYSRLYRTAFKTHSLRLSADFQRHSNVLPVRYMRYVIDNLSLRLGRKPGPGALTPWTRLLNAAFGTGIDHDQFFNPYESRLEYRLINLTTVAAPDVLRDFASLAGLPRQIYRFASVTATATRAQFSHAAQVFRRPVPSDVPPALPVESIVLTTHIDEASPADVPLPTSPTLSYVSTPGSHFVDEVGGTVEVSPQQPPTPMVVFQDPRQTVGPTNLEYIDARLRAFARPGSELATPIISPVGSPLRIAPAETPVVLSTPGTAADYSEDEEVIESVPIQSPAKFSGLIRGARALPGFERATYYSIETMAEPEKSLWQPAAPVYPRDFHSTSPASDQFYELCPSTADFESLLQSGRFDLACPDAGLAEIIHLARNHVPKESVGGPEWLIPHTEKIVGGSRKLVPEIEHLLNGAEGRLAEKITRFFSAQRVFNAKRRPFLTICGVPASGKSSGVREYLRRYPEEAGLTIVITPGRQLQKHWREDSAGLNVIVRTQHDLWPRGQAPKTIIIDEAYSYTKAHLGAFLAHARAVQAQVLLCGDPFQRSSTVAAGVPKVDDPIFSARRITIKNSNAVPLDAWSIICRKCNLNPAEYRTRSKVAKSVLVASVDTKALRRAPGLEDWFQMRLRKDIASDLGDIPSVGAAQGVRVELAMLDIFDGIRQRDWFLQNRGLFMIGFSRHTSALVCLVDSTAPMVDFFAPFTLRRFIATNGDRLLRGPGQRHRNPFELDIVPRMIPALESGGANAAVPIELSQAQSEILQAVTVIDCGHVELVDDFPAPLDVPSIPEITGFVAKHVNFDSFKDHEHAVDFVFDGVARGLRTVGELEPPKRHVDMRSGIPDVDKLAEVQKSADRYNDLYNAVLRQFATSKPYQGADEVIVRAQLMLSRFFEAFGSKDFDISHGLQDHCLDWFHKRAPAFRNRLSDQAFGEDRRSLAFQAFLKTQTKAKPEPGYAAGQNYGQQIITNSAEYSAFFSPHVGKIYERLPALMRPDVVADFGFTDAELSRYMHVSGLADAFKSGINMQIDVTRQDSSHSAVHVLAFCMLLEYCGVPSEVVDFYYEMRASYKVVSLAPNLYAGQLGFNLPSGDPFTLVANVCQMLMTIACRFQDADIARGLQKGDDATFDILMTKLHPLAVMPEVAAVQFKIDTDLVFYHASRFWNGRRLLVDPVRAFLKHFTRSHASDVPTREYYVSYLDRATDYTASEVEFLRVAVTQRYAVYDSEDIDLILRSAVALRQSDFFFKTSRGPSPAGYVLEASTDCARFIARKVFPGRNKGFYKQFVGRDAQDLADTFATYGVTAEVCLHDGALIPRRPGLYITQEHAFLVVSTLSVLSPGVDPAISAAFYHV